MPEKRWTKDKLSLIAMVIIGIIVLVLTAAITVRMLVLDFILIMLLCFFAIFVTFMTTVKFHSPMVITETEIFTMFDSRAEVVYDPGWGAYLGVVFVGGYNAAKRFLSKQDIEKVGGSGTTTLLVTASPFMIESMARDRFFIVRGTPLELSSGETAAFLARPGIRDTLGREVGNARVYFVLFSKTLYPDEFPKEIVAMEGMARLLQQWRGEVAASSDVFSEEFLRKLDAIKTFRETPIEQPGPQKISPEEAEK